MRVLVTGSTGFIGGALCQALVARGYMVRAFHRPTSNLSLLDDLPVEHAIGDLTDPPSIEQAMQNVDIVFHAAAMLGNSSQPGRMYTVTVEGTQTVLTAAIENGVQRVIHTSSVAALGIPDAPCGQVAPQETTWMNENHTWNYRPDYWPYGYSKYLAELEVQKAVAQGLDAVIVNPSYVLGAGDLYRKASSLVVQVARQQLPFIPEGGLNVVHIDDVIDGHLAAMEGGLTGDRYILGNENITVMHLVTKIAEVVGVPAPRILVPGSLVRLIATPLQWLQPVLNLPVQSEIIRLAGYGFYFDTGKANQVLALKPGKSTQVAIQDAVNWFRNNGVSL